MVVSCPRCSRINPAHAVFCYHDGTSLGVTIAPHASPAQQRFPMPFVFPSGKTCHTFDELVLACNSEWRDARDLLRDGAFGYFLNGVGRADLARVAMQARNSADRDGALNELLRRMPSTVLKAAKVTVSPASVNLGQVVPGKDVLIELTLHNEGMGLLSGSVVSLTDWLFLGQPNAPDSKKLFQFLHETTIPFHIPAKRLRASSRPFEGQLLVETQGSQVAVPVTFSVPIRPFPDGVLAGARTPREIAEKAKEKPTEAGEAFASGAVQRWYAVNGWDYPVREAPASGVAAVQQFFEALGLTKPPKVVVNRRELFLSGRPGEQVAATVQLCTEEKKPVWVAVTSNADWLDIREVDYDKRTATVHLGASRVPARSGQLLEAQVTLTTNGRVRYGVTVRLDVSGGAIQLPFANASSSENAFTALEIEPEASGTVNRGINIPRPPLEVPAPRKHRVRDDSVNGERGVSTPLWAVPDASGSDRADSVAPLEGKAEPVVSSSFLSRFVVALIPLALVMIGLIVPLVRDWVMFSQVKGNAGLTTTPSEDLSKYPDALVLQMDDTDKLGFVSPTGNIKPPEGNQPDPHAYDVTIPASMRFGLTLFADNRKLTFERNGISNNCVILVDNNSYIFGDSGWRKKDRENAVGRDMILPGRWLTMSAPYDKPGIRFGRRSVWLCDTANNVKVTQTVGLTPGTQSRAFDTCRIHYRIENGDEKPHRVGLRFLLDTYIGENDGVPFLIPGQKELCSTFMNFDDTKKIPDFIQACERADLNNPGTVAQIGFRLEEANIEPPDRVTLSAYPNPALNDHRDRSSWLPLVAGSPFMQEKTKWAFPLAPIHTLDSGDSAVTVYWDPRELNPGESREVGFTYGLGRVSSSGGSLALTVGGSFVPNGEFTLTAYVSDPNPGAKLQLFLPQGFSRVEGDEIVSVPPLPADGSTRISPVTWKIRSGPREGAFDLKVKMGATEQTQPVQIKQPRVFSG